MNGFQSTTDSEFQAPVGPLSELEIPLETVLNQDAESVTFDEEGNQRMLALFKRGMVSEKAVATHFERLIYFTMNRYQLTHEPHILLDVNDCYNLCLFGLFKAIEKYQPAQGKFSTYAVTVMTNELVDEFKKNHRAKRCGTTLSLDSFMVEENLANHLYFKYASTEFLPDLISQEVESNVIEIIRSLSAKEQSKEILIELFIHQKRPKDVSVQYGITPQAVHYTRKWFMPQLQYELRKRKLA